MRKINLKCIADRGMSKTELARTLYPGRTDRYARRLLYDFIMNHRTVTRNLLNMGWRPCSKMLTNRQVRYLRKAFGQ